MGKEGSRYDKRLVPGAVAAVLLGIGLHELFSLWPSIITEFISPVNESLWEHLKILFWPLLAVELVLYPKSHRGAGLTALFAVCAGMLAVAWVYHVVLGGSAAVVNVLLFLGAIMLWFWISEILEVPDSWLPMLRGLLVLLIGLILAFTVNPPHGTLFNDPMLADAWSVLPC